MMLPTHCGYGSLALLGSGESAFSWTWPPYIIVPLIAIAILYAIGVSRMCRRTSQIRLIPVVCFVAGWLSLVLALDSPMHELSEQLFWVHMTQHEVLVLVSAPLLVLGRPLVPFLWALPAPWRNAVGDVSKSRAFKRGWLWISAPVSAWLLHAAALWAWHAPALFTAAVENDFWHAAQHVSFLGTALLFWWALLEGHAGRLGYGGAVVYVFTTIIHTSALGAWLTFSPSVWYTPYLATAPAWHLSALEDQQIGGLIMWIPAGTLLTAIGLGLLLKWMSESQRRWEYTRAAAFIRMSGGAGE
jgi:putative membrane protein